jgi:hypothetical protein
MAMTMALDDCPHAMQAAQHGDSAQPAGHAQDSHKGHAQDKNTCDMGMNCPAFGAPGMASAGYPFFTAPGAATVHATIEPHYTSHVPEGLQRPPRQRA